MKLCMHNKVTTMLTSSSGIHERLLKKKKIVLTLFVKNFDNAIIELPSFCLGI